MSNSIFSTAPLVVEVGTKTASDLAGVTICPLQIIPVVSFGYTAPTIGLPIMGEGFISATGFLPKDEIE